MNRAALVLCLSLAATPVYAGQDHGNLNDARWDALIASAINRGGVETISGDTGSYVFVRPDGMIVTFTRRLDNKIRLICVQHASIPGNNTALTAMNVDFQQCLNWNTGVTIYATRASESAAWVFSDVPPTAQELDPEQAQEQENPLPGLIGGVLEIAQRTRCRRAIFRGWRLASWRRPQLRRT